MGNTRQEETITAEDRRPKLPRRGCGGGFGLPQSVDGTFTRLVDSLDIAWSAWSTETGRG
ncbi:MAG: hypothetical protein ABR922_18780 [Streptosporangiaceae bacterium]